MNTPSGPWQTLKQARDLSFAGSHVEAARSLRARWTELERVVESFLLLGAATRGGRDKAALTGHVALLEQVLARGGLRGLDAAALWLELGQTLMLLQPDAASAAFDIAGRRADEVQARLGKPAALRREVPVLLDPARKLGLPPSAVPLSYASATPEGKASLLIARTSLEYARWYAVLCSAEDEWVERFAVRSYDELDGWLGPEHPWTQAALIILDAIEPLQERTEALAGELDAPLAVALGALADRDLERAERVLGAHLQGEAQPDRGNAAAGYHLLSALLCAQGKFVEAEVAQGKLASRLITLATFG